MENQQNSAGTYLSPQNQVFARTRSVIISSQPNNLVNPIIPSPGTELAKNKITQSRHELAKGISQSQIIDKHYYQSSLTNLNSSKYQNKYSFKKYTRAKMQQRHNPEGDRYSCIKQLNQHKVWLLERDAQVHRYQVYIAQRDKQLAAIRDLSFQWQSKYRELVSNENKEYTNCLTQIYNISTQAERSRYSELAFVNVSQSQHYWHTDQTQSIRLKEVNQNKKQTIIASLPQNYDKLVQMNGLRQQIQIVQKERFSLIDRIRYFERNNASLQQTVDASRYQIASLKNLPRKLMEVQQHLNIKENQLVLAQKHIFTLQQKIISLSNNSPHKSKGNNEGEYNIYLEGEIRNLRGTIARYTEDIEQIEIQKNKYLELLNRKEQQSAQLTLQFNRLQAYLEQVKNKQVDNKYSKAIADSHSSLIWREEYKSLLLFYGKKTFQSIILLEEINRLNTRFKEQAEKLTNAKDQIIRLSKSYNNEYYNEAKLKQVQEQYNRNLTITQKYETDIANFSSRLKMKLGTEISVSEKQILELKQQVRQLTAIHQQFRIKNENLTKERDDLLAKNVQFQKNQIKGRTPSKDRDLRQLEDKISQLNLQLLDTTQHLNNAQKYIEQNLKAWTSKRQIQTQHASKLAFLDHLTKDFQLLKTENEELLIRLNNFGTMMEEHSYFKSEYERLSLLLKQYEQGSPLSPQLIPDGNYQKVLLALRELQMHLTEVNPVEQLKQLQNSRIKLQVATEQLQRVKKENKRLNDSLSQRSTQTQILKQKEILLHAAKKVDEKVHVRKSQHIQLIKNSTTSDNVEYVYNLEKEMQKLRNENQLLAIHLKEKNVMLGNVESKLFEAQDSLKRQSQLLEVSQRQWRAAQSEIIQLKEGATKIYQLEQYLKRAESFIIEEEQKHKSVISTYEDSLTQLRGHLEGAEQYIITLEDSYNKSRSDQVEYDGLKIENRRIKEQLVRAEQFIEMLEQQIRINRQSI